MVAHVLHFSRTELLELDFDELVEVWYVQASAIFSQTQAQNTENLARMFNVVFPRS